MPKYGYTTIVTEPAAEPLTTEEVRNHLRIDTYDDNTYLASLIIAARRYIENKTNRALVDRTIDWYFDCFPVGYRYQSPIELPYPPLVSVTHVKYIDVNSVLQTWGSSYYTVDTVSTMGRIYPNYGQWYPTGVQDIPNAVVIRFVAGYTITTDSPQDSPMDLAANIPQELKHAMLLFIGHYYNNREEVTADNLLKIPMGIKSLINDYIVSRF